MIDRRGILAGGATTLILAGCGRAGSGAASVLRVGSQKGSTKSLMLAADALNGAGYSVEWAEFPAAQHLLEALGSGAIDVGVAGDAPFQFAYQSGSPIRAVGAHKAIEPVPDGALAIMVPAASPVHDVAGLRGRRIATTRGSVGHYLVLRVLQRAGWPLDAVRIVFLSPSDARAALQAGAVDAWSTWVPYTALAQADGARIAVEGKSYVQAYGFDVAWNGALPAKREILADFLRRETGALAWARTHIGDYAALLARETGLPLPIARETVLRNARVRAPIDDRLIANQQEVLDTFKRFGAASGARAVKDAFDKSFSS